MESCDQVRLAGRRSRLADLRSDPEAYLEAFTRARSEDRHAICLCSPSGHPAIIDAAVMLTSPSFISAESSHEITGSDRESRRRLVANLGTVWGRGCL